MRLQLNQNVEDVGKGRRGENARHVDRIVLLRCPLSDDRPNDESWQRPLGERRWLLLSARVAQVAHDLARQRALHQDLLQLRKHVLELVSRPAIPPEQRPTARDQILPSLSVSWCKRRQIPLSLMLPICREA